ncbi:FAD-dependent monooxygenase [Candidatus Pelagibacter communis]|uniref:FAD-dependent monooxygenase n=1 Tax=Pelagibacter ubique TaxID=198252 RepID=UPI00094D809F|nr:NAD(P)/FAD-dependent oxidoreductase [Candidatus Pelagibacter ubique]
MKSIAIVGSGISGLFLANLLEKNTSFSYKIFEKKPSLDLSDGYGIQLSVNSINLLNKIGFQTMNASEVFFPKKVNFFDAKVLEKICDIDLSQFNFENNRYTTLKRSKLIDFLLSNIPKDKIIFNSDLINIEEYEKLKLSFSDNTKEEFDYLVAADGVYSRTKEILFKKEGTPKYFNSIALRGNIQNFENSDISLYLGSNFHFVIYPINQNNEFNFISIVRKKLVGSEITNRSLFKDKIFINNLMSQISSKSDLNLSELVNEIKCFPIFVSKKIKIPNNKNIFLMGDAFFSFPPSFAQGASQSIESANDLFNDLNNNLSNYYKKRVLKTKQINYRSSINHHAFHIANPINVFFRNIFLKYLSKNKSFLENYLGKIYKN